MRRKRSRRSDVFIDLTSLLDVIFILLLVVLCGQKAVTFSAEDKKAEAEQQIEDAQNTQDIYNNLIDNENNINQMILLVSVGVPYDQTEIRNREIKILVEGKEIESFPLIGNSTDDSFDGFKNLLIESISKNNDKPVILSLNDADDKILYRDEEKINDIFNLLKEDYANVYIK